MYIITFLYATYIYRLKSLGIAVQQRLFTDSSEA